MPRNTLFWMLLLTAILCITGARELARGNYPQAAMFFAIPICAVLAYYFGAP